MLGADPQIEVVGTAADGREAVARVRELNPDVVTMDVEMPVLDGIGAVREIMASCPTPVLMFSSLTHAGAQATFDALEAGALDFLPKRLEDIAQDMAEAGRLLCARLRLLARRRSTAAGLAASRDGIPRGRPDRAPPSGYQVVAIGASTGGPVAVRQVLESLPASFPLPILLVLHMPASFTAAFATRLDQCCAITVREAADGDVLSPGKALLAPGGCQLTVETERGVARIRLHPGDPRQPYRPSVDTTFSSLAGVLADRVLAVVLTGMGADGCEGARRLKQAGSTVWAQDEKSCVVYGMPAAVVAAGVADRVLPLAQIGAQLQQEVGAWIC
jgi:two-component system chemotaxis response regulator CheB